MTHAKDSWTRGLMGREGMVSWVGDMGWAWDGHGINKGQAWRERGQRAGETGGGVGGEQEVTVGGKEGRREERVADITWGRSRDEINQKSCYFLYVWHSLCGTLAVAGGCVVT
jgi:hypothetical protein